MVYDKNQFTHYFPKDVGFTLKEKTSNTFGGRGDKVYLTLGADLDLTVDTWRNLPGVEISIAAGYWFSSDFKRVGKSCSDLYLTTLDMPLPEYTLDQILENIRCGKAIQGKDIPLEYPYFCVIWPGVHARIDSANFSIELSPEKIIRAVGKHYQDMEKRLNHWKNVFTLRTTNQEIHRERLSQSLLSLCSSYGLESGNTLPLKKADYSRSI